MFIKCFKGTIETNKIVFDFLNNVKSTDKCQIFMSEPYLDIDNKRISATDGGRLIIFPLDDYELTDIKAAGINSGYFTPIKVGKIFKLIPADIKGQYPNLDRVIPDYPDNWTLFTKDMPWTGNPEKDSPTYYAITEAVQAPINYDYMKPLKDWEFNIKTSNIPGRPAMLDISCLHTKGIYVIMPMLKVKDEDLL